MTVIDMRFRPPTDFYKELFQTLQDRASWSVALPSWYEQSMDDCVREMEELNVVGVVTGRLTTGATQEMANDHIKDIVDKYPGRFIPVAAINFYKNRRKAQEEIARVAKLGFRGINLEQTRFHPEPMLASDRRFYPIYAQCEDLGLFVSIFTSPLGGGTSMRNNSPYVFDQVAEDFPELHIYLAHGCYPLVEELTNLIWRRSNVWFSIDCYLYAPGAHRYVEACNYDIDHLKYRVFPVDYSEIMSKRFCFGSAMPFSPPLKVRLEEFKKLGWKEEILDQLLYKNAAELIRLNNPP